MNEMGFGAALILASALIAGCSSRVELDVDREKIATAVKVEDHVTAESQQSGTSIHFRAQSAVADPVLSETVETHEEPMIAVAESPPTEARQEEVQQRDVTPQVQTITTTIQFGDINLHIGDSIQTHQQSQAQAQTFQGGMPPAEQPPVSVPLKASRSTTSQAARDAYHERLRREHEMRVQHWQLLFQQ